MVRADDVIAEEDSSILPAGYSPSVLSALCLEAMR